MSLRCAPFPLRCYCFARDLLHVLVPQYNTIYWQLATRGFSVTIYNSRGNQVDIALIAIYNCFLQIKSNQILAFGEKGKPEYPGKNRSYQSREPTNSIHIWRRVRKSDPGHIGGRQVLSPLSQPCRLPRGDNIFPSKQHHYFFNDCRLSFCSLVILMIHCFYLPAVSSAKSLLASHRCQFSWLKVRKTWTNGWQY